MKRRFTTALVMLLAFALLIGTTAITASAETTTYTPIGGSTTLVKNLVVDKDANIPDITFNYTIRRGTPQDATATTIEILESPLGGGSIGSAVFSNADTASAIPGVPSDAEATRLRLEGRHEQHGVPSVPRQPRLISCCGTCRGRTSRRTPDRPRSSPPRVRTACTRA